MRLPKGTLVQTKPKYDQTNTIKTNGNLWVVRNPSNGFSNRTLYQLVSLTTGAHMTTHPDNFVVCVDEEEEV